MNPDDERLARALHDAVSDVEPRDALADIRARTRTPAKVETMSQRRTWPFVLLGAAATAAVVATYAIVGGLDDGDDPARPDPVAASSSAPATPSPSPTAAEPTEPSPTTPETSAPAEQPAGSGAVAAYFIGDTERGGPRLYREFQPGEPGSIASALELITGGPRDPDYYTAWPEGSLSAGTSDIEVIIVDLGDASLLERPAGMDAATAKAAVQQVVYSVQAAVQRRTPVWFMLDGEVAETVYDVDTREPLMNAPVLQTLSHLNITTPEQGATVSGTIDLTGVSNGFEGTVAWELRRGAEVVKRGAGTAEGWMEDRLFPFEVSIPLDGVPPGDYTIWATTDDPTGGTEGVGAMTDSKEITVR